MTPAAVPAALLDRAASLDAADDLAPFLDRFVDAPGVEAYLDGNSLGRPLRATLDRLDSFVRTDWGTRLIRSWDERWMHLPTVTGDRIGRIALGARAGQTVVADSTSILLYKLIRAAVRARPGRDEILMEESNFPTDRFIAEGIADELSARIRWISPDPVHGVTIDDVAAAVGDETAVAVFSHVDYRSGAVADMASLTKAVHDAGALVLWDLCHSVGVIPIELDSCGADLAVGCTYKYLNGGPGSPAFAYVRADLQNSLQQPIWGWMGAADVMAMADGYTPSPGIRQFISGTPPVLGMIPMNAMLDLIEEATVARVRRKAQTLTDLTIAAYDAVLADRGVRLLSPREADRRGGHVTFGHETFSDVIAKLWSGGVIPDFRYPDGIRVGLSPLSTTHADAVQSVLAIERCMDC